MKLRPRKTLNRKDHKKTAPKQKFPPQFLATSYVVVVQLTFLTPFLAPSACALDALDALDALEPKPIQTCI